MKGLRDFAISEANGDSTDTETTTDYAAVPPELTRHHRWVNWILDSQKGKPPVDRDGQITDCTDPETWREFSKAIDLAVGGDADGIGFVLTDRDDIVAVDLDDCVSGRVIEDWARGIVDTLDSYTEFSPSGTGIHIYVLAESPGGRRRGGGVEMYPTGQFVSVTGNRVDGTPATVEERTEELQAVYEEYVADTGEDTLADGGTATFDSTDRSELPEDDEKLLEKAKDAANGDKFTDLWNGRWESRYPTQSHADFELCRLLAFWTDESTDEIDRLFRKSDLMRKFAWGDDKDWDQSASEPKDLTYGEMTIRNAIRLNSGTYGGDW